MPGGNPFLAFTQLATHKPRPLSHRPKGFLFIASLP